jgi:hypothetical protein
MGTAGKSISMIFFFLMLVGIVIGCSEDKKVLEAEKADPDRSIEGWAMSQEVVRSVLKAPSIAKFGPFEESSVTPLGASKYRIVAYVDSQNSFGAMLRSHYTVDMQYTNGKWRSSNFDFKE